MTVKELIAKLSAMPADTVVQAWDEESQEFQDVISIIWDSEGKWVFLHTDYTEDD